MFLGKMIDIVINKNTQKGFQYPLLYLIYACYIFNCIQAYKYCQARVQVGPGQVQVRSRLGPGQLKLNSKSFNIKVYFKSLRDLDLDL